MESFWQHVLSENKDYEPIYLNRNDMESFWIIGKVVWISRDV